MKLFKRKNLMGLIYGIFVLLPFCAILSRVIYVQSNKNAYESYSGLNQNTQTNISVNSVNEFDYSKNYYIGNSYLSQSANATSSAYIYFDVLEVISNTTNVTNETILTFDKMYIYANGNTLYYNFYTNANVNNTLTSASNFLIKVNLRSYNGTTSAIDNLNFDLYNSNSLFYIDYFINDQLDNVFEYSVNKFLDENNFGKLDFFQWFSTLFLDSNAVNNMYLHFINWYMNYLLYVSLGYLIFSVLMWFVNFFRGLVEKSTELNL